MRLHVDIVCRRLPEIKRLLETRRISLQRLYDHSAFLTRYTDVTP
jgi:hypothetical protein